MKFFIQENVFDKFPDNKIHGANMGPMRILSAPDGPHVGPMNLAIRVCLQSVSRFVQPSMS